MAWWRGYINQITYGADLRAPVDDFRVHRLADELIRQRIFTLPVADYYNAATEALRSSERLGFDDDADEGAVRDLLARLIAALDERKPWPDPPYTDLPADEWRSLQDAPVIGRISKRPMNLVGHLNQRFSEYELDGQVGQVIVLRLRTGQKVGLRVSSLRESNVQIHSTADPETTRQDFHDLTGLDVEPA